MVDMESTVEVTQPDSVSDDAVQDQATVETEANDALEQFLMDEPEQDAGTEENPENTVKEQQNEVPLNKGIKGRIAAAEAKADKLGYERGRTEAMREFEAYKAEIDAKLRKFQEMEIEQEARELARAEKCSVELAKRIIKAERGINPAETKTPVTPHAEANTERSFSAPNDAEARAKVLMAQAESIRNTHGVDTLEIFRTNEEVRKKVGSGAWDMRDVLVYSLTQTKKTEPVKPAPAPKPVHSGGNAGYNVGLNFETMTNEQFAKFKAKIRGGASFRPR